jgi:hypothetical protein
MLTYAGPVKRQACGAQSNEGNGTVLGLRMLQTFALAEACGRFSTITKVSY